MYFFSIIPWIINEFFKYHLKRRQIRNNFFVSFIRRAVARTLIGGGGCIFIYLGSARLTSFEINLISKETSRAKPEYMNMCPPPPPINALATALFIRLLTTNLSNLEQLHINSHVRDLLKLRRI